MLNIFKRLQEKIIINLLYSPLQLDMIKREIEPSVYSYYNIAVRTIESEQLR